VPAANLVVRMPHLLVSIGRREMKARDGRLGRTAAINVLPSQIESMPKPRERFEREARTIASLNHPHICTLHDVVTRIDR
jgi:serine/threonine protein kinase